MSRDGEATFWVERWSRVTRFDRLAARLVGDERYGPYLFVLTVLVIDAPVLSTINYLRGNVTTMGAMWWEWPGVLWWTVPVLVLLAVFFLRTLSRRYHRAAREIGKVDDQAVDPALPRWLQYGMLLLGLSIYVVWFSFAICDIFARIGPVAGVIKWFVFIPLVYYTVATDLAAAYIHVQVVLPVRVRRAGVPLDFSDPRGLGGFYPLGRVMRVAAVSAFVALSLYTVFWTFALFIFPANIAPVPTGQELEFFALLWSLAALLLVAGLYLVHRHMAASREEQLDRIHREIRLMGKDEETLPYTAPGSDAEFRKYVQEYVNLDRVERTRTFPFRVSVAWELVGTAMLPVVLQILSLQL